MSTQRFKEMNEAIARRSELQTRVKAKLNEIRKLVASLSDGVSTLKFCEGRRDVLTVPR